MADHAAFYNSQLAVRFSHLSLVSTPVRIVYQEGDRKSQDSRLRAKQSKLTLSLTLGQTLLKETLYRRSGTDSGRSEPYFDGDLVTFTGKRCAGNSDLVVVYSEESVAGETKSSVDIT